MGKFLKEYLTTTFAARGNPVNVKYIDPSYMIRTYLLSTLFFSTSSPANAFDSQQCLILAENVVHGVMAGMLLLSFLIYRLYWLHGGSLQQQNRLHSY